MYDNILIPVALEHGDNARSLAAAKLLRAGSGRMTVLHVVEAIPGYATAHIPEAQLNEARAEIKAQVDKIVAEAGEEAVGKVITGHPGASILEYAEDNDIDCIVIASHKPGLSDYFLGSTAARVVRHAACAVHVIR